MQSSCKSFFLSLLHNGQTTADVPPLTPRVTASPRNGCDQSVHVRNRSAVLHRLGPLRRFMRVQHSPSSIPDTHVRRNRSVADVLLAHQRSERPRTRLRLDRAPSCPPVAGSRRSLRGLSYHIVGEVVGRSGCILTSFTFVTCMIGNSRYSVPAVYILAACRSIISATLKGPCHISANFLL